MSSTCMKVPSDKPMVASARLDGRKSPTLDAAALALEAMSIRDELDRSGCGRTVRPWMAALEFENWSLECCDELNEAAIADDRMKKVSPWADVLTFAELEPWKSR
jgi:hypothetical protein